jgi:tRNA A-37 threonylcarbamoyl transferase component Bud32
VVYRLEEENGAVLYSKWLYPQHEGLLKSLEQRFKRLFRGPRVRHIYLIHRDLLASGFGCPEPVFSAWRRHELTELFVCREVAVPPLHRLLRENDEALTMRLLSLVAKDLRRLHQSGFVHGDALPGNICVDEKSEKVFYLDNDRTRHCTSRRRALRNVIQFCSHLTYYCSLANAWQFFIGEYGVSKSEEDALLSAVQRRFREISEERLKAHRK